MSEATQVEAELDLDMAVKRIENVMRSMPFGGTFFPRRVSPMRIDGGKDTILARLDRIEKNLAGLATPRCTIR